MKPKNSLILSLALILSVATSLSAQSSADNLEVKQDAKASLGMYKISTPSYLTKGDIDIKGFMYNYGQDTIKTLNFSYSINGASPMNIQLNDLSIAPLTSYHFKHPDKWNATTVGTYNVKVWLSEVNGESENSNSTLFKTISIGDTIPNIIDNYINKEPIFNIIAKSTNGIKSPTDLDFHPNLAKKELWVINRETESVGGSTVKISNAGDSTQTTLKQKDGNAYHFMSLPSGIAFSENENFATSPSVFDANHDGGNPYTGPSLWSSDSTIYAQPSGGNGSHLDMMHESPNAMGITHEAGNAFWLYDGNSNDVVRYDFSEDHGPGNDDHSDGIVWRYPEIELKKINTTIPNHLVLDKKTNWLYIVDNGNKRVLRLDITSGSQGGTPSFPAKEILAEYTEVTGVTWEDIITTGLEQPSGIALIGNRLIVGDYSNGDIVIYDLTTAPPVQELYRIKTNKPGLTGITIGPEGHIWYTNYTSKEVVKLEAGEPVVGVANITNTGAVVHIYPNPASDYITVTHNFITEPVYTLMNVAGQTVLSGKLLNKHILDLKTLSAGMYYLKIKSDTQESVNKIVIMH